MSLKFLITLAALTACTSAHAEGFRGQDWEQSTWYLGGRFAHLQLEDVQTGQSLPMAGAGFVANWRATPRFGLELALDAVGAGEQSGEVKRTTVPITASAQIFLFTDSRLQLYVMLGGGVAGHTVEYEALGEEVQFTTPVFQAGLGLQYHLRSTTLDMSVRGVMMERDEVHEVRALEDAQIRSVNYQPRTGARSLEAVMFTAGLSWGL